MLETVQLLELPALLCALRLLHSFGLLPPP
jgi:hypothetical protein